MRPSPSVQLAKERVVRRGSSRYEVEGGVAMKALLVVVLLLSPALAWADDSSGAVIQPASPQPTLMPPAPPENPEPPPEQGVSQEAAPASGQWVYTSQYGWVWMPYGDTYTYLPTDGGAPDMYVYYPSVGWCWVVAPWIWGWGAAPYFGIYGTGHYGWYGYGYGHWYGYAGPYANWYGRGYWSGGHWYGSGHGTPAPYHPAAPRGGYGYTASRGGYYAAGRGAVAAPRTSGFAAPRSSFGSSSSAWGHSSSGFAGHPSGGFGGHAGGGFGGGGHAGGGGGGGGHAGGGGHR